MAKKQKGNRESKKPKTPTDGTKKPKKDPGRYDNAVARLFKNPLP
jgi:hypothetical protein